MRGTLRNSRQYAKVYESGRRGAGRTVVVFGLPGGAPAAKAGACDPAVDGVAVGFVASRKVGGAVARNRAKRLLRAAFHVVRDRLRRPIWLVLVARRQAAEGGVRVSDVLADLEALLADLGLLREEDPQASSRAGAVPPAASGPRESGKDPR